MGSLTDLHLQFMPTNKSQFLQADLTNFILQNFNTLFLCLVRKGCLEDKKSHRRRQQTPPEDPV